MSMIESQPAAVNRNKIIQHVEVWKTKLGSYAKVAQRCGVNEGGLSRVLSGTYGADERNMLVKLAKGLDYRETSWHMVREVGNYKAIAKVVHDAKAERMWFGISNKAGSGKTGTLEDIYNQDTTDSVVFLQAEEWSARQFIVQLVRKTVGASQLKGKYKPIAELLDLVANYFNEKSLEAPVLIIDEADKLKPAALRLLIPLYNKTEDRLGLVLSGTENLSKEMERGVKHAKKGYDELDSRLGRNYITLKGGDSSRKCTRYVPPTGCVMPMSSYASGVRPRRSSNSRR